MKFTEPRFITSVADGRNFYHTDKPLVAVSGKSNVGKSSLINMLGGNSRLARTSVTPGRTRLINYFDFGGFTLADLPGYGFAKVAKEEKDKWGRLLEDFFASEKISLLIQLIDIRRTPNEDDKMMLNYLYHFRIPFILVATKADKLPKTRIKPTVAEIAACLRVGVDDIIVSSAEKRLGKNEILYAIEKAAEVSGNSQF